MTVLAAEAAAGEGAAAEGAGAARAGGAGPAAARRAKGGKGVRSAKGRRVGSRPITGDMAPGEVTDELQRRKQDAAEPATGDAPDPVEKPDTSAPSGSVSKPLFVAGRMDAAHAGGGFVLGVMAWAIGINYLHGGLPRVKQLLAAKFLNKTSGGAK